MSSRTNKTVFLNIKYCRPTRVTWIQVTTRGLARRECIEHITARLRVKIKQQKFNGDFTDASALLPRTVYRLRQPRVRGKARRCPVF
jgi:hypothetical protein